jgi:hypothetical protein
MTDQPLVRTGDDRPRTNARRPLIAGIVALLVLAAVAAGAWWYLTMRERPPDWDRAPSVALAAPAGDPFGTGATWTTLQLDPARSDQSNNVRLGMAIPQSTPTASPEPQPRILGATAQPIPANGPGEALPLQPDASAPSGLVAPLSFAKNGWWRLHVDVDGTQGGSDFYLLIPDPNVNGPGAVASNNSTPEAAALFQRGLNGMTSLKSVQYSQWLADGQGNAGISDHAVSAGGDGAPSGFTYRAPGGIQAIVIGTTRWIKLPRDLGWTKQEAVASVPPSEWGAEYAGATQFAILGEETIDGAPTQILSFLVPEATEPRQQSAAWYLWWVDTASGHVRQEAMVSRFHYMLNKFSEFDVPVVLKPPPAPASPTAGTPSP